MLKPEQTKLSFWNNQNLFSKNYLEHRLPNTDLWKEQKEKVSDVFDVIKKAYEESKTLKLGPGEEAGLEDKFIRPVLQALGYEWDVQPTTKRGLKKKRPDYALFKDKASLTDARKEKDNLVRFFKHPVTILEAKYWGRRLNDADPKDTLDKRDPTAQTVKYLDDVYHASESRIQWAILTNGKHWRLFYFKAASRSGNFFEIDLEEILIKGDIEKFLYFYLFFSKDAFIPDSVTGATWLDQHLKGTEDYAARVSTKLKELIFDEVFEGLAEGFVHYRRSALSVTKETDESKKEIFKGCLTLLYRLLFLLYAESRNLLPIDEEGYNKVSLSGLKRDIHQELAATEPDKMSKQLYTYWARLESLFNIIANGEPELNVPVYNGGLFETQKNSFLACNKISDPFLARAIELLTVDHEGEYAPATAPFIDYSSLNVRHLGDIYEGLLEFHVQIAEEEMAEVKEKGKLLWKTAAELKKEDKVIGKKQKGAVYIENSKHERKATGSYYTPHYIVEYIVKNTVGPVLEEKLKTVEDLLVQIEGTFKASRKQTANGSIQVYRTKILELEDKISSIIFDIKVLDPAMGSGHFLVHAVDFISDKIVSFLADYPENQVIRKIEELRAEILKEIKRQGVSIDESKLTEVNLIKRMVMKRCIYGVDLNDMAVELAKLSLWLDSFTLGAPLSFLDHHLKCGNSLIGVFDISDVIIPGSETYSKVQRALSFMLQVSELTDATITEAKKSYDLYKHVQEEIDPIRRRFNVATARYFMDLGKSSIRVQQLAYTMDFEKESYPEIVTLCKNALQVAEEKRFFHWKLEFPEVFYTMRGEKENQGFDCVIGNPPYETTRSESMGSETKKYLGLYPVAEDKYDYYWFFINKGNELIKKHGYFSMIIPDTWLMKPLSKNLRRYVLENSDIISIDTLGFSVFEQAVPTCILTMTKPMSEDNKIIFRDNNFNDLSVQSQTEYNKSPYYFINPSLNDDLRRIAEKTKKNSYELGKVFVEIYNGVQTGNDKKYLSDEKASPIQRPIIRGADVDRYSLSWGGTYILWLPDEMHSNQKESIYLYSPKILIRQTADRLIATIDRNRNISLATTFVLIKDNQVQVAEEYLLAILNSAFLKYLYQGFNNEVGRIQPQIKRAHIEHLPIPRISFTTPEKERKEFFKEAVKLYKRSKYDDVIKWADYELALKRTDTSHNFLAYLAGQMIDMNKAKNEEIKDFLKWLEREIGAEIDGLTNKTGIKEYHEHDFDYLLDVLKKNKNKISIDPSNRKTQELFEKHFSKSMTVLEPLKNKIKVTDELINDIVYKLYGLTPEEIAIVEGKRRQGVCERIKD